MTELQTSNCDSVRQFLDAGHSLPDALAAGLNNVHVKNGLWRFFSRAFPDGGAAQWNAPTTWRSAWGTAAEPFYFFGEDLYGNQLAIQKGRSEAVLWDHESAEVHDLYVPPLDLLRTVAESGLDWIDFYSNGSLHVATSRLDDVPSQCHLHWTTPLILGGAVDTANTSIVECASHLVGHASLWQQVGSLPPGTTIIPR